MATAAIDAATTRRLATVARGANATMFMLFLTGLVSVLSRYARQTDMVIAGVFTSTVPLRISLPGDPTFTELLGRVRDTTIDALQHQDVPFEKLLDEFAPDRTLGYAPLVQVRFGYGSGAASDLPGTAMLDLSMYADVMADGNTTLALEYRTDLFDAAWAGRFLGCLATLLGYAADSPGIPVAELPMLSPAERDALILGRNRQAPPPAGDISDIRRVLLASTSRVIDGDEALPMSEVCDRAARIGRMLADRGAGPETLVGLCAGRGTGMLTALLGVWWAGAGYVPMDPGYPRARLTAMARSAELRVIICDAANRDLAWSVAGDAELICLGASLALAAEDPLDPVPVPATALAYVIFTSGSTGQPKGVEIEHRAVTNLVASFRRAIGLGSGDRFVAVTTMSFDIAVLELLLPLACGADLVIATDDQAREPGRLRSLIERTAATAMQATPQTWRMLVAGAGVPGGLRLRMCGGEALSADLADQLISPGATVWNVYGPTETTVWSAAGIARDAARAAEIGPPIEQTRVYVLDDLLMPVPVGVVGEVCLAGRGVARGYHDRPMLTAGSFRPDPWSSEPGGRMYRTGDLGRWREGGGLELVGRNDHQVKIRGFRVELGEIETVLRRHRDVREAVVVIAAAAADEATLVAYVVPRRGSVLARPGADLLAELRPQLSAVLPDYMIPALLIPLPVLPLTSNAKVDRSALPSPPWAPTADRHV